ncbi:MAG: phospholipid carrier-dependent glycosyltransferase [Bryobacteraceae bacterium]
MKRGAALAVSAVGLFFLYFFGLTRTGLIGPDEARYAAIGRAMAATGDWITPRLWGAAWFEKPAWLYWMTATGFKVGLGPDWAPRLPVALASVAFLIYFFVVLKREFGERAAWYAATILATSAGWLAYSHIAITDLPMSAAFAAAMLMVLSVDSEPRASASGSGMLPAPSRSRLSNGVVFIMAGGLLGIAVLAKGLVPLVLFIPALWFLRHRIRDLALLFVAAAVIGAPWYVLVSLRNGAFLQEFIWKHHFGRFLKSELQHQRPVWFYVPVLLAGLFPWTPLVPLAASPRLFRDTRAQFLLAWFAWGFVFFSISRNKLPGYLLPLLPPLAALVGIALSENARARILLAVCGFLLCLAPALATMLPLALESGISRASFHLTWPWMVAGLAIAGICAIVNRGWAVAIVALLTTVSAASLIWRVYPELDRQLSGRSAVSATCLPPTNRSQRYSLDYYAGRNLPDCK